ncbi:MAG: anti-sigma factor antagonist [Pseudonocardia sp.]|uniref:STAS domain-containing protein n=1 Tax=Pseudonocardia sp. TaxID=60912 RepID=UPI001ACB059C|nr:STAS domain-containing protein [Pseudonocardia sp.]MBN9099745.1 anti-sigma factor antagonist [Pseudonocardia sp.]
MAMSVEPLTLSVEDPTGTITVVFVAGDLNRASAPRLARLVDSRLDRCAETGRSHIIVDLACVRNFGQGGLHVLRHAQFAGAQAGVVLHLTGLSDRVGLLPTWVSEVVARFDTFPSVEAAVLALSRVEPGDDGFGPDGEEKTQNPA